MQGSAPSHQSGWEIAPDKRPCGNLQAESRIVGDSEIITRSDLNNKHQQPRFPESVSI